MAKVYLIMAILAEVAGTSALKASDGFSRPLYSAVVVLAYGCSFYFLALVLKSIPVGIAYSIWCGLGIVLITLAGAVFFRQIPDLPAVVGMLLIVGGVAVIYLFSSTMGQ